MTIYIGADHRGFAVKEEIKKALSERGYTVIDVGDDHLDVNDDYPQFAGRCATAVLASDDTDARGILLCGSGQGMCMSANRYKGIRAALGFSDEAARLARNDDDANVLCLPADLVEKTGWDAIVTAFLNTPFAAAPRYLRRLQEMDDIR